MKAYHNYFVSESAVIFNSKGKVIKQFLNIKGYPIVSLRVNKKPHTKAVHRIVAETYISNPDNLTDVDHIDGNRTNNHVSNLRWVTHGENIKHSYLLSNRSAKGENNARSILTEKDVHEICKLLQAGVKPAKIRDIGFPYAPVRSIAAKKNWRYISEMYF